MIEKVRIIERYLPLKELNLDSTVEVSFKGLPRDIREEYIKTFGVKPMVIGPRLRNIHTWFARRPCSPARVLTLTSVLPSTIKIDTVLTALGFKNTRQTAKKYGASLLLYTPPNRHLVSKLTNETLHKKPENIVVLDPMAGGGSIPLESLRLGFKTIAIDYNPVAYLILKATLEFPAKYADAGLFEETLKAAKEFISRAHNELGKYYGEDAENYIFARGVRCPFCNGLIPVQGIEPVITKAPRFKRRFLKISYEKSEGTFTVETTDMETRKTIEKRGNNIKCPYCGKWFQLRGKAKTGLTAFNKWFIEHAKLMENIVEGYFPSTSELEEKLLELHIPLVKQSKNEFIAVWDDKIEREKFIDALNTLSNEIIDLQSYIPLDEIPKENKWATSARNNNLTKWYMLFNPRQLLTVAKLSKLIAEIAEKLVSKNGEMGAAIALYLAFAVDKIVDYNTIATSWHINRAVIRNTLTGLGLGFRQEYTEIKKPKRSLEWALEINVAETGKFTRTTGGILSVLRFLCSEFSDSKLNNKCLIYLGDATRLSEVLSVNSIDVINVDPPYFEQVIYSDRSELFWIILRRSLAPVLELLFKSGLKLSEWNWHMSTVPRRHEVVTYDRKDKNGRFRRFFGDFINETYKVLKEDGILVLWFTHPTDIAWESVGEALYNANYVVSKVWPVQTEMKTRFKHQIHGVAQEMSLIIIARKYPRKKLFEISVKNPRRGLLHNIEFIKNVKNIVKDTRDIAKEVSANPADTTALLFGSALSVATKFEIPGVKDFNLIYESSVTAVVKEFVEPLIEKITLETGPVKLDKRDSVKVVELVTSAMLRNPATRSYVTLWMLSRVDLDTGIARGVPLALSYDFAQTTAKLCGYDFEKLKEMGLLGETIVSKEEETERQKKGKAYYTYFFEVLSAAEAQTTWNKLTFLIPGKAIYLAYLSLTESGAPSVRAKSIRNKLYTWSDREVAEAAALAIILLETTRDVDLGYKSSKTGALDRFLMESKDSATAVAREIAIKTLLYLLPRI